MPAATDGPAVALSFANNFWGKDDAGVGPLLDRMASAKQTSDELRSFYSARASIEDEYARKLMALCRKPLGSHEMGSLKVSLDTVRGEVECMAKQHATIASQMKTELEEPLAAFAGGMKERRKIVQNTVEKLLKVKIQQTNAVNKTRDRYEQDCLKIKGYLAQGHMVMGQEERKNKARLEKTQISLAATNADYENAVKVLEDTTARWNREWKSAADRFQDLEEERLDFTKSSLWSFANIASTVCVSDDASCEKIRLSLEKMDVEKDITHFITEKGTGQEIPDPPKYINFCRGDVEDHHSETDDDENYSVAQFPRSINPAFRTSSPQPSTLESHHDPNSSFARGSTHQESPASSSKDLVVTQQKVSASLPPQQDRRQGNRLQKQIPQSINPGYRAPSPQPSTFESHHDPDSALARDLQHYDPNLGARDARDVFPEIPRNVPRDVARGFPRDVQRHEPSSSIPREMPRDAIREAPRDAMQRYEAAPIPRDMPRDASRDLGRDMPREAPRETPKDAPRDISQDVPRDTMTRDIQRYDPNSISRDVVRGLPRDISRDISRDVVSRDVPREAIRDIPREVPRDMPMDISREVTREIPREVPREILRESPREVPRDVLRETPRDSLRDIPRDVPRDVPREAPREVSRDLQRYDPKNSLTRAQRDRRYDPNPPAPRDLQRHDPISPVTRDFPRSEPPAVTDREPVTPAEESPSPAVAPQDRRKGSVVAPQYDTSQFAAVPHDPYPMDGMTMLCRTDGMNSATSSNLSARPSSRDEHSDYSNPTSLSSQEPPTGKVSPVKQEPVAAAQPEKQVFKKKSGFFQSRSPFRRKSIKESQAPPVVSNRNTWAPVSSQNTISRRSQAFQSEPKTPITDLAEKTASPEPIEANASLALNIGQNVFPVANTDKRSKAADSSPTQKDEPDPIALALAELKGVTGHKQSAGRISADHYHGIVTPVPERQPAQPQPQPQPQAQPQVQSQALTRTVHNRANSDMAAGLRGTPPPSYDQQVQRLGVPPPAVTSKAMQEASRKYVEQTRDMFGSKRPGSSAYNNSSSSFSNSAPARPTTRGSDMPRAASPAPTRSASPHTGAAPDSRQSYRSASPNPYSGGQPQQMPSQQRHSQSPRTSMSTKRNSDQGSYYRHHSPSGSMRTKSPSPIPYRGDYSRPTSRAGEMAMQLAPVGGGMGPGSADGSAYGGSMRGRGSGRPGTSASSRAMTFYDPRDPVAESTRQRSKSVADPSRQYTPDGRAIIHYARALYMYQAAIPEELGFAKGDILAVLRHQDDGWWEAEIHSGNGAGRGGLVPSNYLQPC
ncbi:hypothetical protein GGS23DRAFT_556865 [Durotheca rogersii]|uniref:uncharacterized protein n=1 Tax=Durotheca rogersii TaxID=419775 RepID=UPI00221F3CCF|nr:uncharacterized protein GGS23DRAFT_556865 [Durotheca rogersii]KAI5866384.1 hypothetical protein GGS23DRAFT_556865 [Durotheca rogersii]